jgi:hypothetical protein
MSSVKDIREEALRLWAGSDDDDVIESYQFSVQDLTDWCEALMSEIVAAKKNGNWASAIPLARHIKEDAEALVAWTAVLRHRDIPLP